MTDFVDKHARRIAAFTMFNSARLFRSGEESQGDADDDESQGAVEYPAQQLHGATSRRCACLP